MCLTTERPQRGRARSTEETGPNRCCQTFVAISSLFLAVLVLILACVHLNFLFEAFVRKNAIQSVLSSGHSLDSHQSFLWYLLYSFGETQWSPSTISSDPPTDYEYDLRIWKLSGLVSAYTLAIAVNIGLFVAATFSRMSALFIPWIVINFVAILGFFSLSLGIVIVHVAYNSSNESSESPSPSSPGAILALAPLVLALILLAYWSVVVKVYLATLRKQRSETPSESSAEESSSTEDSSNGDSSLKKYKDVDDQDGNEQKISLLGNGVSHSGSQTDPDLYNEDSEGFLRLFKGKKRKEDGLTKGDKVGKAFDSEKEPLVFKPQTIVVETQVGSKPVLVNVDTPGRLRISESLKTKEMNVQSWRKWEESKAEVEKSSLGDADEQAATAARSPFLPEMRPDKIKAKKAQKFQQASRSYDLDEEDDWRLRRPMSNAEEVNLWTEFDNGHYAIYYGSLGGRKKEPEPVRRFSRRRQRERRLSDGRAIKSVHFEEDLPREKHRIVESGSLGRKLKVITQPVRRSRSSHGREAPISADLESNSLEWSQNPIFDEVPQKKPKRRS